MKNLKKRLFIAAVIAGIGFTSAAVLADKVLFFTPTRVLLNDLDNVELINITNLSPLTRAYQVRAQDLIMTEEGVTAPVESFDLSAKRMIRYVPRQFTLAPGERQTVRVMSRIGPQTEDGEYHTHLRFLEDVTQRKELNKDKPGQAATIAAPLAYEALIPVILSHGNVSTQVNMTNPRIVKTNVPNEYRIDVTMTRQGNGQGTAYVDTTYTDPSGNPIVATPRRTVYIYREIDQRNKDIVFQLPPGTPTGGNVTLSLFDSPDDGAPLINQLTIPLP